MRIEQLEYLIEVAETGSINLAAEKKYISQQSLSEAIQKLEKEFGINLIERSYKGVYLTETGKLFVEKAKVIINNVDELKKEFQSNKAIEASQLKGNLSIIISPHINNEILQNTLAIFNKEHPKVNIIIEESDYLNIISAVAANKADIGILLATARILSGDDQSSIDFNNDVIFEKLYSDKVVMCVGKTSPLANRKSISFKEALKYPIIVYQPDEASDNSWYINRLQTHGKIERFIVTASSDIYRETIVKGLAMGYSTTMYLKGNPSFKEEIKTITISDNVIMSCGWVRPKNRDLSEAAKEFIRVWHRFERHTSK